MSVFQKRRQKILAELESRSRSLGEEEPATNQSAYEKMLAQLRTHEAALKRLKSIARKIEQKREWLGLYDSHVEGCLAADTPVQDDVLMTQLVWRLDCGLFEAACDIAAHAHKHDLKMPERFKRDLQTYVTEELAEAALKAENHTQAARPDTELLLLWLEDIGNADMPDEVLAKFHKAIACGLENEEGQPQKENAIRHYQQALGLDPRCGVKKRMEKLQRTLPPLQT